MIIKPRIRGFICITSHPQGCAANVAEQIQYIKSQPSVDNGPKNVLVLGSSTGFGLASRIMASFGCGANTLGVFFEKPPTEKKTASAGYYNAVALERAASEQGLYAKSINGDAFSKQCKAQVIDTLKSDMGPIDLVIYSLAAPRRVDPETGEIYTSVLKPVGQSITQKNLNTDKLEVGEITIEQATQEEIDGTIKVMGGEDWELWLDALLAGEVLAQGCKTTAYTYIGDKLTWPIYGKAAIGKAKLDLDRASRAIDSKLKTLGGSCNVSVLKAVVTQASSAIPVMPLYLAILFKIMKQRQIHEGCIEQLYRLYTEGLYANDPRMDDNRRFRVDDRELTPEVQREVERVWDLVTTENLAQLTDSVGYHTEFLRLFGFGLEGVDYAAETSPLVEANF